MSDKHIFVTGGTGILGQEILPRLLHRFPFSTVSVLVRAEDDEAAGKRRRDLFRYLAVFHPGVDPARIEVLRGDITKHRLGIGPAAYARLRGCVTHVIHAAATIKLSVPPACAEAVNVGGTAKVLRLAHACKRLRRFAHISTAYVAGTRTGRILESESRVPSGFLNAYEESKFRGETIVHNAMRSIPVSVFRPGILVGDSRDGHIASQATFYVPLRHILEGSLRSIPGDPEAPLDLIPVDVAAECIVRLLDGDASVGRTYHVTAGRENLVTVREFLRAAMHRYGAAPVPSLTFTDPATRLANHQKALRSFFDYLCLRREFDDSCLRADLGGGLPPRPHPTAYLGPLLDFCRRTRWGTGAPWEDMLCAS
jgi:long-chain acyl-CoA synthetase